MRLLAGLRGQLLLLFALVFGGVTLLASGYQYRQLAHTLHQTDDQLLLRQARQLLARTSFEPLPTVPLPGLGEQLRVVAHAADQPDQELFRSPAFPVPLPPQLVLGQPATWQGQRVVRLQSAPDDQDRYVTLWLAHSGEPLSVAVQQLRQRLAWALLGSLALAAVLAALLGHRALRPLRRMARAARRLHEAPGLQQLPEPATGDEVQDLARTLNQMLRRLHESAQLQENFLAAAAHELRTPLATLHAGLHTVQHTPALPAAARQQLAAQQNEVRRLSRLVDDLLLSSRLRAGALPLHRAPVPLDELAVATVDRLLPQFRSAGRPLHLAVADDVPSYTVSADADKLTTVLGNLLENALRHALPGGEVRVSVGREAATGWLYVEVANPIRHSLGNLSRLTTAYYQADVLSNGAGLGLWLSNQLAELHGAPLLLEESEGWFRARLRLPPLAE
ncbi:sensor histidine kinase [Hymenobacter sp. 102]|uniref:sensor histidine kinase n=1 Tax=Hymenobacter sp. 102 TaxID=3403152 RepID=UPI003CF37476